MKYKRTQKRSKQMWQRVEKFSIRKFSFGAASCLIGASLVGVAINPNIVDAAFKQLNGEDGIVSLYSNSGETPESADGIQIGSKVNVDKEIGIDVDWSQYTRENPIVKVTYTYNGGADGSSVTGFGGHRPRFWFTTPIGLKEPKEITLKKNDGRPVYVMESWNKNKKFGSLSNSINSRFQTEDDINRAYTTPDFHGNDTKWESYNETTGESYREYSGSFANKFWYHIGDRISDDPYEQAIYENFRTNTKTMYVDWERGGIERATITAVYEVADPTFGNDRSTLEFGAGFRVGIARMMQHYKTVLAPVPSLYKLNEIFEPSTPTRATVGNPNKLTEKEKNIVRDRIWSANKENVTSVARTGKNKLIENLKSEDKTESILIDDDGTATIIYSDNSRDVIPGTSLVYKVTETNTHRQGNGYEYDIAPVAVKNMDQITEEEKKAAIKSFLKANGIGVENLQYHSGKSDLDFEGGILQDDKGNKWFAYDDNTANAKNIGTHIGFKPNSSTVMLSRDAGYSGVYTIPTSDLYYKEGTSALDLAKKDAEAAIDNLNYLSPKEKQAFKEKLKDKTTQESVNAVVEEAVAKNSENEKALETKKREVKEKINNNPYLTTAEKKELVDQVSAVVMTDPTEGTATPIEHTKGLVDKILDKALEKTKEKAKAIIDEIDKNGGQAGYLENPTAAQYKEQIQNATTQEAIAKVIEDALNQKSKKTHDAEKAKTDALKDEYKKKIDQVPGLTDAQRDEYKKQIDAATTRDQLEDIVKDAEVKAYRDTAKAKIDALEHLNAAQKAELKTQVDAAGNKAEVDNIVSIAQGLDSKMDSLQKLVEKAKEVKGSEKYNTATQDKKDAFDTAKDAASKVADKTTAEPENAAGTSEVATLIDNLAKAIEALTGEKVAVPVSKDALKAELDLNTDDAVKKSPAYAKETDAAKKKAYDDALANAQKVYDKQDATQTDVDNALETLKQARLALSGKAEDFTLAVKDGAAKISVVPKVGESLTEQADKDAVKAKVTANGNYLDDTYSVEYGAIAGKGDKKVVPVTVTHDGITRTVDVPVEGTDAAKSPLNDPEKVKVNNVANLSEDEKAAVKAAVKKANTNLTDNQISVDNTGKVTVTYSDKSQNELPASKTVEAKTEAEKALDAAKAKAKADLTEAANKEKVEIEADKNLTDQQKVDKKAEVDKGKKEQEANIDKAQTTDEVAKATEADKKAIDAVHQTELDKAKEKAKSDLTDAANKEKAEIEADNGLTKSEKEALKQKVDEVKKAQEANIDKANTPEEVASATTNGKQAIAGVHTPTDIKEYSKELNKPENKVKVTDTNHLTDEEKEAVKKAVADANPGLNKGDVTVNPDGSVTTPKGNLPKEDVVTTVLNKPNKLVEVENPNSLTVKEKEAVKKAVAEANPGLTEDKIKVDDQGNVTTPKGNLPAKDVVTSTLKKPTTPVEVVNPAKLTEPEKAKVVEEIIKNNPGLTDKDIKVDDQGNVETPKGNLPSEDVVTPALKKPTKPVEVKDPNNLTDKEKEDVKKAVIEANKDANGQPTLNGDQVTVNNDGSVETPKGNLPAKDVVTPALKKPTTPVVVENPTSLTEKEKEDIKNAVAEANKDSNLKPADVTVNNDGSVSTPKGNLPAKDVLTTKVETSKGDSVTRPALPELSIQDALVAGEVAVEKGKALTDEDILKQLTLVEGVAVKVVSKPTTTETGTKEALVEITLANGNKVTVKVPVVVYEGERPEVNDLGKAKEDAKKQVEKAAKDKIEEIKKRTDLSENEKTAAIEKVNKAKEDANTQIENATSAGTAKAIGEAAAKNITDFDPKANPAEGVKPVDSSKLDEEKAKAIAEIEQAAKDQTDAIKNNTGLTKEQKDKAIKDIEDLKATAIENVRKATTKEEVANVVKEVETAIKNVDPQPQPQPGNNGGNGSNQNAQANSDAVEYAKQAAKNILEEAARAKKAQLEEVELSADEKAELFAKVDAEKQAALDEIAKAKDVDTVKQLVTKAVAKIKAIQPARNAQDNQDSQDAQNAQNAQDAQNHSNSNPTSLDAANVRGQELPATGTGSEFVVFNAAAISILTGLGLAIPSKKKETEK